MSSMFGLDRMGGSKAVIFLLSCSVAASVGLATEGGDVAALDTQYDTGHPDGRVLLTKGEGPEVLLIFMFCGMVLGALITHILSRTQMNVPYTVVVFIVGVLLFVIIDKCGDFGQAEDSIRRWKDIDPELLLYLFLPALLFGEAMNLSWYKVKACFYQAALLAGPGVLIGAYVMAMILYYICPFGWSWYLCVIFGSIVAATDPVAVVAILKDLGASPKLTILIVGESLMNDGTAMVLFTLYFKLMEGEQFGAGDIIWFMIKMIIFSPLLGVVFGLCGVYWLSKANNPLGGQDTTIQIGITVSTAYLVFYVAQYECEISGILACCAAGLVFAFLGPPLILEHETMHSVWGFIEWTGNTLIFLLAGCIIGSNLDNHSISASDFGYVLALYLILLLVRCLVVALLFPGLSRLGLKCSASEAKFMCWAGLRGTLAISLSLIVYGDYEKIGISRDEAEHIFFWIGGIAAMTLFVNATTAQALLIWLGLLEDESAEQAASTLNVVKESMRQNLYADMKDFRNNSCNRFSTRKIRMSEIVKTNTLLSQYDDGNSRASSMMSEESGMEQGDRMVPSSVLQRHLSASRADSTDGGLSPAIEGNLLNYYRRMFLESIRRKYWKLIEQGRLPRGDTVSTTLLYSVDTALRRTKFQGGRDWEFLAKRMTLDPKHVAFVDYIADWVPKWASRHSLRDRLQSWNSFFKVYLITSFIDAHEETQASFVDTLSGVNVNTEENMLVEQQKVLAESKQSVVAAKAVLQSLDQNVVAAILVQQTARLLLAKQITGVRHLLEEGILQPKDADQVFNEIQADYKRLDASKYDTFVDTMKFTVHNQLNSHNEDNSDARENSTFEVDTNNGDL